jgi:ABC-type multidrug transport system ATPase subunit
MDVTATPNAVEAPMDVPSGSDDYDHSNTSMKNKDKSMSSKDRSFYLRWSRLQKTVQVKELSAGLMSASISTSSHKKAKESGTSGNSSKTSTKVILNSISACAAPGEVLAIMGPSGSGKTSLMNVLSGRSAYESGVISINGEPVGDSTMKRLMSKVAYVKQADVFFGHLTVRDQLTYTALLRMPSHITTAQKHAEVERVVQQLRLSHVADSPINLVSGGEKKRVNIGTELLTDPIVLLLDEPTSGLDSTSAVSLLKMLQALARSDNKTIITSIHQPSSAVFRSFDQLLMLSQGHVVYFGSPVESLQYLRTLEGSLKTNNPDAEVPVLSCPDGYNAADHWMDLLVADTAVEDERREEQLLLEDEENFEDEEKPKEELRRLRGDQGKHMAHPRFLLQDAWDNDAIAEQMDPNSTTGDNNNSLTNHYHSDAKESTATSIHDLGQKYNTSWATQYYVLTHRALKNSRSAIFTTLNLVKSVCIGAVAGLLWFQMDYTEANVNDIRSYFFFVSLTFLDDCYCCPVLACCGIVCCDTIVCSE